MSGLFENRPVVLGASLRSLLCDDSVLYAEVLGAFIQFLEGSDNALRDNGHRPPIIYTPLELLSTPWRDSRR